MEVLTVASVRIIVFWSYLQWPPFLLARTVFIFWPLSWFWLTTLRATFGHNLAESLPSSLHLWRWKQSVLNKYSHTPTLLQAVTARNPTSEQQRCCYCRFSSYASFYLFFFMLVAVLKVKDNTAFPPFNRSLEISQGFTLIRNDKAKPTVCVSNISYSRYRFQLNSVLTIIQDSMIQSIFFLYTSTFFN
jgi:hypothetical protein